MADKKIHDLDYANTVNNEVFFEVSWLDPSGPTWRSRKIQGDWLPKIFERITCGDETTPLTTGLKYTFRWHNTNINFGFKVDASLTTAQASGGTKVTIDIKKNGGSIFTTPMTFDNGETTTITASVPHVFDGDPITSEGDEFTIIVDAIQSGSAAAGLKVYIGGTG